MVSSSYTENVLKIMYDGKSEVIMWSSKAKAYVSFEVKPHGFKNSGYKSNVYLFSRFGKRKKKFKRNSIKHALVHHSEIFAVNILSFSF